MMSYNAGINPRNYIQNQNEEAEETPKVLQGKRSSEICSPTSIISASSDREEGNVSVGSSTSRGSLRAVKPQRPPPKPIKSKSTDDGYNSSSYSSGEKPQDDGPSAAPLISFRGDRSSHVSHRPSMQDEAGYEIPRVLTRPKSTVDGVVASDKYEGVTLKFHFKRKSQSFNDKDEKRVREYGSIRLQSLPNLPDNRLDAVNEIWTSTPIKLPNRGSYSPDSKYPININPIRIPIYFFTSLVLSLGLFVLLYFFAGVSLVLSLSITITMFIMIFVAPLTFGHRRIIAIMVLLAPSLFTGKTKVCLCITIAVLIIAGPICNISRNIMITISYQNSSIGNTSVEKHYLSITSQPTVRMANKKWDMMTPTETSFYPAPLENNHTTSELQLCKYKFQPVQSACRQTLEDTCQYSRLSKLCIVVNKLCPSSSAIEHACAAVATKNNWKSDKLANNTIKADNISIITSIKVTLLQLLPLLFILFLHEAYIYNRDYLSNKEMDNIYITGKLKVLDCERRNQCLRERLFPLRKLEFRKYILPSSFRFTAKERKQVEKWIIVWIMIGFIILISLLLDHYILEALQVLTGRIGQQQLQNDLHFTMIDTDLKHSMFVAVLLLFVAIAFQSYVLRSRSRICSFFYPKYESRRGVYLYYKILHERTRFWKYCRERIRHRAEARKARWRTGVAHRIFAVLPKTTAKIVKKCFLYRCMICNSLSWRKTFVCRDNGCCATFCYECYIDMGESCISCNPSTHQLECSPV